MNLSMWELGLIVLVALLVLGPKQFVFLARSLGRYWHYAQRAFESPKDELHRTVDLTDTDDKQTNAKPTKKEKTDGGR